MKHGPLASCDPFATSTSTCRSKLMICSVLYRFLGITSAPPVSSFSHSRWPKFPRSCQDLGQQLLQFGLASPRSPLTSSLVLRAPYHRPGAFCPPPKSPWTNPNTDSGWCLPCGTVPRCSPRSRKPPMTIRTFSSAVYRRRVARRMSRTTFRLLLNASLLAISSLLPVVTMSHLFINRPILSHRC